jgi:hypothetical protein
VEALYPNALTESQGQKLTGANKYVIHFYKGQSPPVNAFWSITLYNNASYLADNPIDRYSISDRTPELVTNEHGSLDYLQHDIPGLDKESNWLPTPAVGFSLNLRLYNPQDSILNREYQCLLWRELQNNWGKILQSAIMESLAKPIFFSLNLSLFY